MSARKVTLVLIAVIGLVGLSMFNPTVKNWGRATLLMFERVTSRPWHKQRHFDPFLTNRCEARKN